MAIPKIAKELSLSSPTVTKYVSELCDDGLLADFGKFATKEGRYPNFYGVNPEAFYFLGVDIHSFVFCISLVNVLGECVAVTKINDFKFSNTQETFDIICDEINKFIDGIEKSDKLSIKREKLVRVNINVSGRVNPFSGFSFSTFNFSESPLSDLFTENLGIETIIDNDTRAMAYGEYSRIYKNKASDVLVVNVGWGLGLGIISNGEVCFGRSGYAGEFGHINIFDNDIMCHCGKKGCLETEVSGLALYRQVLDKLAQGEVSVLSEKFNKKEEITIQDIISAISDDEDMLCIEELEIIASKLGRQVANLINIFNPEVVVLGGILAETGDYLLYPVKTAVKKYSLGLISSDSSIVLSKLKDKAGVIGACLLARDSLLED